MIKKLCAWIISRVDNRKVIHAFEILRKIQRLNKRKIHRFIDRNIEANRLAWANHKPDNSENDNNVFIENQRDYEDMSFGKATMKYSGCEIFAVFNLLQALGESKVLNSLPDLISAFEEDGMLLSGMFGTAPKAIRDFFEVRGFSTHMTTRDSEFDELGDKSDSLILTMFNNGKNVFEQVHTINISKEKAGFVAHNVYGNGHPVGPYSSVSEVIANINGGKAKGIALIGVNAKK